MNSKKFLSVVLEIIREFVVKLHEDNCHFGAFILKLNQEVRDRNQENH
ncbi:hypothetical protein [Autumnicola psychrophila]|uniref:Uncharacterized protein n=1 Tax=Autumnicola psychrophila TaxID=3075592 RepID=A0ABU3DSV3_9FLAO|nr:hypothetical protein [Zunongwangia sp. F225]MDT0686713.1 hypothetical protein [Zunongwangia sp. F225]